MNRIRLTLVTASVAATAFLASGCAAGGGAATLQVQPDHAAGQAGSMLAQNIVVVVDPTTGAAQLTGTVINSGGAPDQLVSATVGGTSVPLPLPLGIDAKTALNLASASGTKLVVTPPAGSGVKAGTMSTVHLMFAAGGDLKLDAAVEANTGIYAAYEPSATPGKTS